MSEEFLYKPILEPERKYDSDIEFEEKLRQDEPIEEQKYTKESLDDNLKDLDKVIAILPEGIEGPIKELVEGLRYVISTIYPTGTVRDPEDNEYRIEIIDPAPPEPSYPSWDNDYDRHHNDNDDNGDGNDNGDGDDDPFFIFDPDIKPATTINAEAIDPLTKIDDSYNSHMTLIIDVYIKNLKSMINEYSSSLFSMLGQLKDPNIVAMNNKYTHTTRNVLDVENKVVSDRIIKNQILRDQKLRLYKKIFNKAGLQKHLRSCQISKLLKKRYKEAQYIQNSDYMNITTNTMLSEARKEYEEKYKSNFLNFYKYLNSSVILMRDCLALAIDENRGKLIIMEKEGLDLNVYEKAEVMAELVAPEEGIGKDNEPKDPDK